MVRLKRPGLRNIRVPTKRSAESDSRDPANAIIKELREHVSKYPISDRSKKSHILRLTSQLGTRSKEPIVTMLSIKCQQNYLLMSALITKVRNAQR